MYISVAQRVADERGEPLGRTVGYSIRMESCRSPDTRLLMCTTGVLVSEHMHEGFSLVVVLIGNNKHLRRKCPTSAVVVPLSFTDE